MRAGNWCRSILMSSTQTRILFGLAILMISGPLLFAAETDQIVGDIAKPVGLSGIRVQGVGLVTNLAGTGSDPKPSIYREKLKQEIQRVPGIDAEGILGDPYKRHSLVIVRANISAGMTPEDELNVEVLLPPGSETTSLDGGVLLETRLYEVAFGSEGQLDGKEWVRAYGPVITGTGDEPEVLKTGKVLGGGRIRKPLPYAIVVGEKHRSRFVAETLQEKINYRFQYREGGYKRDAATAKTTGTLVLNVPKNYHHNQRRYLQVITQLQLQETPALVEQRLEAWGEELLQPKTAGAAAVKLEGVGSTAIPVLLSGLESPHPQVRFFAAEALAYLDDPAGSQELKQAALEFPEFRSLALAGLAAMYHPAGRLRLRELMAEADPELRYGAFNAIRITDPGDPYLGRVPVLGLVEERRRADDPFALEIGAVESGRKIQPIPEDPFELYVVPASGPSLIHVSRTHRREIVLFGEDHELLPPVVLGGIGPILLNASVEDDQIEVTRIDLGSSEQVIMSSTDLVEVIRSIAALGGTYPQVISILQGADKQANLTAMLQTDAIPNDVEAYDRAQMIGDDVTRDDDLELAEYQEESESQGRFPRLNLFKRFRNRFGNEDDALIGQELATAPGPVPLDEAVLPAEFEFDPVPMPDPETGIRPTSEEEKKPGSLISDRFRFGRSRNETTQENQETPKRESLLQRVRGRLNRDQ